MLSLYAYVRFVPTAFGLLSCLELCLAMLAIIVSASRGVEDLCSNVAMEHRGDHRAFKRSFFNVGFSDRWDIFDDNRGDSSSRRFNGLLAFACRNNE